MQVGTVYGTDEISRLRSQAEVSLCELRPAAPEYSDLLDLVRILRQALHPL